MKTAKEAKQESMQHNDNVDKQLKTLLIHFENKVNEATKLGKFNVEPLKLMKSQIPDSIMGQLEGKLKGLGYGFSFTANNAEQTITVYLSW